MKLKIDDVLKPRRGGMLVEPKQVIISFELRRSGILRYNLVRNLRYNLLNAFLRRLSARRGGDAISRPQDVIPYKCATPLLPISITTARNKKAKCEK